MAKTAFVWVEVLKGISIAEENFGLCSMCDATSRVKVATSR